MFVRQVPWNEELWKVHDEENYPYISAWTVTMLTCFPHCCLCQSAQNLRSSGRFVRGIHSSISQHRETLCTNWQIRVTGHIYWSVQHSKTTFDQWASTGEPSAEPQGASGKSSWRWSIDEIMYRRQIHENCCFWAVFYDQRCWRVLTIWWSCGMSRIYFTSRWRIIKTKRMDLWKYQDWSCVGSGNRSPSRKAWSRDVNWIVISRCLADSTNSWVTWQKKCESMKTMRILQQVRENPLHQTRGRCESLDWAQVNLQRRRDQDKYQLLPHPLLQRLYPFTRENGLMSNRERTTW